LARAKLVLAQFLPAPEPGGMSTNQVMSLLEELAALPCVGMDCVEVAAL